MIRVGRPWNLLLMWVGPGPPGLSIYMLVLLTRLFFNPHTAYSDVGATVVKKASDLESGTQHCIYAYVTDFAVALGIKKSKPNQ
jgi:hypothetical protein